MISYDPFWALCKARGITTYDLRKGGVSPAALSNMRSGAAGISTGTIDRLCKLLSCQPGDLLSYKE